MLRVLIFTFITLGFVSCSKQGDDGSSSSKTRTKPAVVDVPVEVESTGEFDPIASPDAKFGGTISAWRGAYPKSLNMWLNYNTFSIEVGGMLFESLVGLHPTRNEPVGVLAESWEVSEDGTEFTFKMHPKAVWSDGKPITAGDVQFYYDTIMDKANLTSLFRVGLSRLDRPEVIDDHTLRVRATTKHWSNFWEASGLVALPKHVWEGKNFNDINFEFPVVSGPYEIDEIKTNRYISLKRRGDWWGRVKRINQYKYNFDYIRYRSMEDANKVLEALKKGSIDAYIVNTASVWARETNFPAVEKGWVVRQRVTNDEPQGFQGLALNLRRDLFQDVRVRKALSYLLNREQMNDKLMYNEYFLLNSCYPDLFPDRRNPDSPFFEYNPDKARDLLKKAGWEVNDKGVLEKDGRPFELVIMHHGDELRHLNIYVQSMKEVGIQARIEVLSASTYTKRRQNHDYDMLWAAWGAARLRNPEASWSSAQADEIATNNITGLKDEEVDALIEAQKTEQSLEKRDEILRKLDTRIGQLVPYVMLWGVPNHRLLYWNRFGTPEHVLDKFNTTEAITAYWWVDPEREAALEEAMATGASLDKLPAEVRYEE